MPHQAHLVAKPSARTRRGGASRVHSDILLLSGQPCCMDTPRSRRMSSLGDHWRRPKIKWAAAPLREQLVIGASKGIGLETPMQALEGVAR